MSVNACAGVTPAAIYDIGQVQQGRAWWPAQAAWPYPALDFQKFGQMIRGAHVCFLIHGFNVNRDEGYTGLGAAAQEMALGGALLNLATPPGQKDLYIPGLDFVIPLLWSGDWYLPVNYPFLLPDIRLTGRYFARMMLGEGLHFDRISFVTHSMGARVALEALQQTVVMAKQNSAARLPVFEKVIFTAAAVSDQALDDLDYADAVDAVKNFTVVSSLADTVLSGAFPWGNAVEQALWANDPGTDSALGRYGPRLQRASKALSKTSWYPVPPPPPGRDYVAPNHGDYFPRPAAPRPGYPNGWWEDPVMIGQLSQAVLADQAPPWPPQRPVTPA